MSRRQDVCKHGGAFEVRATEATQILACPADVGATALAGTDVDTPASVSLTQAVAVDYDTAKARRVTVSESKTRILEQTAHRDPREFSCKVQNYDVYCVPSLGRAKTGDIVTQTRGS